MGDLILRGNFDPQILPNSKKFLVNIQRALLDIHFMVLLKELTLNFLELGKIYSFYHPDKYNSNLQEFTHS